MPEQYAARGQYDNRLQTYFNDSSNADSTTYAVSTTASNNYSGQNESNYRGVATLCDDGQIYFFQMTPNDGAILHHWNADGTYAGVIMHQEHNNTSYGYEQGVSYEQDGIKPPMEDIFGSTVHHITMVQVDIL